MSDKEDKKKPGGLPIEVVATIQKMYQSPDPKTSQINGQAIPPPEPGWGGKGR